MYSVQIYIISKLVKKAERPPFGKQTAHSVPCDPFVVLLFVIFGDSRPRFFDSECTSY